MSRRAKDLAGQKFGKLTAVKPSGAKTLADPLDPRWFLEALLGGFKL